MPTIACRTQEEIDAAQGSGADLCIEFPPDKDAKVLLARYVRVVSCRHFYAQCAEIGHAIDADAAKIGRDFNVRSATIGSGGIYAFRAEIGGDFYANCVKIAAGPPIGGGFYTERVHYNSGLSVYEATIGGSLIAADATIDGNINCYGATIGGKIDAYAAKIGGDFYANGVSVGGDFIVKKSKIGRALSASAARIGGDFIVRKSKIGHALSVAEATITGGFYAQDTNIGGGLYINDAKIYGGIVVAK